MHDLGIMDNLKQGTEFVLLFAHVVCSFITNVLINLILILIELIIFGECC